MAFDFRSEGGEEFRLGGGPWAVYLFLITSFGWTLPKTRKPKDWPFWRRWPGNYDTNDGQFLPAEEASIMADRLDQIARHEQFDFAVADSIRRIEEDVQADGFAIPVYLKVDADYVRNTTPFLTEFLRKGGFRID